MPNNMYMFGGVVRNRVPAELQSEAAMMRHLGISYEELKKIWWFRHRMYTTFEIVRTTGKTRTITAPDRRLKMIQRKILRFLEILYSPRNSVHGFTANRSVRTNAEAHLKRKYVINMDLKDFFPSILEPRVEGVLKSVSVDSVVAKSLARICCNLYCLPQGAPSSPILSNMVCFRMDKQLLDFAKNNRAIYTRYADDITFSSHQPPVTFFNGPIPSVGKIRPNDLAIPLRSIIQENGFELNSSKLHYSGKDSRRVVTGLKINEGVNVDRKFVRNIRAALYSIEKNGLTNAQNDLLARFNNPSRIDLHLKGKISWLGYVKGRSDPVYRNLVSRFNMSFPQTAIAIQPTVLDIRDRAIWVLEHGNSIDNTYTQGTAFFLSGVGLVTAFHCVERGQDIELFHPGKPSNRFRVTVRHKCKGRDIAILDHTLPASDYYELSPNNFALQVNDETIAAGFPSFGPGDKVNIRKGTVTSLPRKHAVSLIEVTQKLNQGMSGGPLMTNSGEVAGIIHKGGKDEARDFAVHLGELQAWFASL